MAKEHTHVRLVAGGADEDDIAQRIFIKVLDAVESRYSEVWKRQDEFEKRLAQLEEAHKDLETE